MIYILVLFMLACGYYTLSYGVSLYQEDGNRLGGAATIILSLVGTIGPIMVLFMKQA